MMRRLLPLALLVTAACDPRDKSLPGTCAGIVAYTLGSATVDTLGRNECDRPGDIDGHLYGITLAGQQGFWLTMTPTGFNGVLALYDTTSTLIWSESDVGVNRFKVYLPAGVYLAVAGRQAGAGGEYVLSSPATTQVDCVDGIVTVGTIVSDSVEATDCPATLAGWTMDSYLIRLRAGQSLTWAWTTDAQGRVDISLDGPNTPIEGRGFLADFEQTFSYTAPTTGVYRIALSSNLLPMAYTLSFE